MTTINKQTSQYTPFDYNTKVSRFQKGEGFIGETEEYIKQEQAKKDIKAHFESTLYNTFLEDINYFNWSGESFTIKVEVSDIKSYKMPDEQVEGRGEYLTVQEITITQEEV